MSKITMKKGAVVKMNCSNCSIPNTIPDNKILTQRKCPHLEAVLHMDIEVFENGYCDNWKAKNE